MIQGIDYDVAIIGAGLGGLSAGAYLARNGKKVLVVEQHNIVGGAATHFSRQRTMKFEVGLHEMDSVGSRHGKHILQSLGVWDKLEFIKVPEFYRILHGATDIVVADDIDTAQNTMITSFPEDRKAIETFFSDLHQVRSGIELLNSIKLSSIWKLLPNLKKILKLLKLKRMTVGEYLDGLTSNFEVQLALSANMGYFHDNSYELSALLFTAGQSSYLTTGGWFIKGGSQLLSDALAETIRENRGKVITKHKVKEILIEDGRATGIRFQRRKRPDKNEVVAKAKYIIYNGGIPLLPSLIPSLNTTKLQYTKLQHGVSLMTIYISFSKPILDLTDNIYSTFIVHKRINSLEEMATTERSENFNHRGFVFVNYGAIDSGMETEKHYTGVICGFDYLKHWESLEKKEYKQKKEMVMQVFLNRLDEIFPGIKKRIKYVEMATAKTIQRYTLNPSGTVYGFAPTPEQFMIDRTKDIRKQVKNLEFASAWATMGGFSPAISGGRRIAKKILRKL